MTGVVVAGMLIFGTCTVVIQKLIFSLDGEGLNPTNHSILEVHKFEKPWFQTEAMFIGMFGCLAVYEIMRCYQRSKAKKVSVSESEPLVNSTASATEKKSASSMPVWKQYCIVCTPALCDMCATAMMNVGLLWIAASVWQMLRGSMVIFSAVFSKFFLKRDLHASHWTGVGLVAFALVVVAFAALNQPPRPDLVHHSSSSESYFLNSSEESSSSNPNSGPKQVTTLQVAFGCALVVIAQIIQASQIVVEEFLLKSIQLHPVLVVGLEGMWGTIVCSILLCFTSFIPKDYGGEDTLDTLHMFFFNGNILGFGILYASVILCYNLFGMFVTSYTSAVLRTILEGLRCACIWLANLLIYYIYVVNFNPSSDFGEFWNEWSYLQFCGFLFLLLGMFVYNGIVRIDGLYYVESDPFACNVTNKIAGNPNIAARSKDAEFVNAVKQFQTREKVTELRDHMLAFVQNDGDKLEALEAMVGITPDMITMARNRWNKEVPAKQQEDTVVEVTGETA